MRRIEANILLGYLGVTSELPRSNSGVKEKLLLVIVALSLSLRLSLRLSLSPPTPPMSYLLNSFESLSILSLLVHRSCCAIAEGKPRDLAYWYNSVCLVFIFFCLSMVAFFKSSNSLLITYLHTLSLSYSNAKVKL